MNVQFVASNLKQSSHTKSIAVFHVKKQAENCSVCNGKRCTPAIIQSTHANTEQKKGKHETMWVAPTYKCALVTSEEKKHGKQCIYYHKRPLHVW